jgi:small-conductance mechanosensitive channel
MRGVLRPAWLLTVVLACAGAVLGAAPAAAQTPPPQRPFSQLIDVWTRQLDRIGYRADQSDVIPVEIDTLREQASDVRSAAQAAAQLARNDLADVKRLLAPLEPKTDQADQPPESDAVKAERQRLTEQATLSESRVKQCEVIIVRADQLLERLTKLRSQVILNTLLHRGISPLSAEAWSRLGAELSLTSHILATAMTDWSRNGLNALRTGEQDLTSLSWWAIFTLLLWWLGHTLRRRYGRGDASAPGPRDRTIAAAIDGLGLVLVPILAVWLIGRLLAASQPPPPIDALLPQLINRLVGLLLVVGLSATALAPNRPAWRVLPFTDASARHLTAALGRLMSIGVGVDFFYVLLTQGPEHDATRAIGALVLATTVALLTLPALANRSWEAARPDDSSLPALIGGTWWSVARLVLSAVVLSSIVFAALGFTNLGGHLHAATFSTCLLIALAFLAHRLMDDLLDAVAASDTQTGQWVRARFGLPATAALRGHNIALLLVDLFLLVALAFLIPAAWGVDIDAILRAMEQLLLGVRVGGVTISVGNVATAIAAFLVCLGLARLVRNIVRDRVMPTVEAPLPLRQSIDAGLNYAGVIIAILIGVASLGIDFTNLAIVLGALSVGIGLGLQNIANNVISGVILLVERPIKAGDWVSVVGQEGFVRRINIRATEIETFQRTSVIVPNSVFLQNPVINRTYSDTSSRIDVPITVGLGTDVTRLEAILRETALAHPRVLRVPMPIVRFVRITPTGLDFELFVFVAQLEDRQVTSNDLNRTLLARLIEEKIIDPAPVPEFKLRDLAMIASALKPEAVKPDAPNPDPGSPDDAAATPPR